MVNYQIYFIIKVVKIKSADFICRSLMKYWIDTAPSCPDFDDLRWDGCLEKKHFLFRMRKSPKEYSKYTILYNLPPSLQRKSPQGITNKSLSVILYTVFELEEQYKLED